MPNYELLHKNSISKRKLPVNFNKEDIKLFEHELKRDIPETTLLHLADVKISPDGKLFRGSKLLPESFPYPHNTNTWKGYKAWLKFLAANCISRHPKQIDQEVLWITDTWSLGYFHWLTDALPRLFTIRDKIRNAALLLPGAFKKKEYIESSLKPFAIQNVTFINEIVHCKDLKIPSHTAPTGNYNEQIIRNLRNLYADFFEDTQNLRFGSKIYISRSKAQKRKITNEEECISVLEEYGFKTVCFEDHSFEEQVKIASEAQFLISNHGAGLTNMLFMTSGSSVFELRQKGDAHSNCYFALSSALNLNYFYQACDSENPGEQANKANLAVDCRLLRKNIELMLSYDRPDIA